MKLPDLQGRAELEQETRSPARCAKRLTTPST